MEQINVSEIRALVLKAQVALAVALHDIDTKILVGEINRPSDSVVKIKRKRRTKKEIARTSGSGSGGTNIPTIKMDLEKDYQSGRTSDLILPDADKGNTFYKEPPNPPLKTKKERKKREKKVPVVE